MRFKLKGWKKKFLPVVCSAFSLFSASAPKSNASLISEANGLIELLMKIGTLITTSSRQTNRLKENFKSRACSWNPDLCPELFRKPPPDFENNSFRNFDWAMNFVQGRGKQQDELRLIAENYVLFKENPALALATQTNNNRGVLFNGPSGTGKSYMCDLFSRLFVSDGFDEYGPTPGCPNSILRVSSMDVDRNVKTSAWKQLLGDEKADFGMTVLSPLRKYLEENPDGGIIVLEEVDKWWDNDIQEGLRTMIDNGYVKIGQEQIDVRNYLILMTSNMCFDSLVGKKKPEASPEEIELGLTAPETSKSFMNRLNILHYDIMSADELVNIFIRDLDMWNKQNAESNIAVQLSADAKKYLGDLLFNSKQGARASKFMFRRIVPKLHHALKYAELHPNEFESLVEFELVLNEKGNDLVLSKKDINKASTADEKLNVDKNTEGTGISDKTTKGENKNNAEKLSIKNEQTLLTDVGNSIAENAAKMKDSKSLSTKSDVELVNNKESTIGDSEVSSDETAKNTSSENLLDDSAKESLDEKYYHSNELKKLLSEDRREEIECR